MKSQVKTYTFKFQKKYEYLFKKLRTNDLRCFTEKNSKK
jgi:hypothetical protein